ncbi:MAG: glycosyltransferase family 2 protein [Chlorobiaceae bacterium]
MTGAPLACIVILNWNGAGDTIACLGSLEGELSPSCRALVVDNGSTDGSPERISEAFPETELLRLPFNTGYAGGNNAGFRRAVEMGAEYVIFLNNDTLVESGFSRPLLETLQRNASAGVAVPKICYLSRPDTIWYAGGIVDLSTGRIAHVGLRKKESAEYDRPGVTGYATGCCFAMRCSDFLSIGGFDESFAMYAEDVDLSLRVRHSGMSIEYTPSSKVLHKVSASLSGNSFSKLSRRTRGTLRLLRKHGGGCGMACYLFLLPFRLAGSIGAFWLRDGRAQ